MVTDEDTFTLVEVRGTELHVIQSFWNIVDARKAQKKEDRKTLIFRTV